MLFDYTKADRLASNFPRADANTIKTLRNSSIRSFRKARRFVLFSGVAAGFSMFLWLPVLRPYSYFTRYPVVQKHHFLPDFVTGDVVCSGANVANRP